MLKALYDKLIYITASKKVAIYRNINKNRHMLRLLDVGGAGGLQPRWKDVENLVKVTFVEPDKRSSEELKNAKFSLIEAGLWSRAESRKFYLTRKPMASSVYKPNRGYTDLFSDSSRFDVMSEADVSVTALDNVTAGECNQPDFIKLDIQGAELAVLQGATKTLEGVLGLEIEVEFKTMYENQPLHYEIERFLHLRGFELNDYIRLNRWERDVYSGFGELVHGDALYLRPPEKVIELSKNVPDPARLIETYIKILFVYNKLDLIKTLFKQIPDSLKSGIPWKQLVDYLEEQRDRLLWIQRMITRFVKLFVTKDASIHWLT